MEKFMIEHLALNLSLELNYYALTANIVHFRSASLKYLSIVCLEFYNKKNLLPVNLF